MADIAMCQDEVCPKRKRCYRFVATPTPSWQTYADFKFANGCKDFWDIKKRGGPVAADRPTKKKGGADEHKNASIRA